MIAHPKNFLSLNLKVKEDFLDINCIGIRRMRGLGLSGFPEKIPTHVYIWFQHFFELAELLNDVMKSETAPGTKKKWIKFAKCQYERDMYERKTVHKDISSKDCHRCRSYVNELPDKAIWWFNVGTDKCVRMTFKNFCYEDITFECCSMWIKIVGMMEVELKMENGRSIGRRETEKKLSCGTCNE